MSLFFDIIVGLIFLQRDRDADRDTHYTVMKRDTMKLKPALFTLLFATAPVTAALTAPAIAQAGQASALTARLHEPLSTQAQSLSVQAQPLSVQAQPLVGTAVEANATKVSMEGSTAMAQARANLQARHLRHTSATADSNGLQLSLNATK
ncbi:MULTISPECIES: hypothetical protein [unclassified Halomonas]|uniref:hypothetical protein n=1 Tax=unclassified Halomonas TaxID=2609666 RepID=UPI001C968C3D|nr:MULTISPECIES: hypothetical protein [unclassified Halomonas]MBY5924065.1 hypothetical protein [Halomonas sp. DP4Y7-2]MBY6231107.1 hypothetical protein [Halomonas sp. DP4Y7-1]